jgi:demethylspheroidene O-methyltransferase
MRPGEGRTDSEGTIGRQSVRERWVRLRNRILSDAAFTRWAAAFPLTRPIARRRARGIFDLVAGFVYSQATTAALETGLIAFLARGGATVAEFAAVSGIPPEAAARLMEAAAALRIAEQVAPGRYALGVLGESLHASPGIGEMVAHHRLLYADLADPAGLVSRGGGGGRLASLWTYAEGRPEDRAAAEGYSRLMAATQPLVAKHILDAVDLSRARHLLDIGGGEGAFLEQVGARYPHLALSLFDLPEVAARARARLGARAQVHAGSFRAGPIPEGADVVSLVRVAHDHDDPEVLALFTRIAGMLPPRGRLIIAEPLAGTAGAEPAGHAYFGLYLLAMGSGRPRTAGELAAMLKRAGFRKVRERPTHLPLAVRILEATR